MCEGHNYLRSTVVDLRHDFPGSFTGIQKLNVRPRPRFRLCRLQHQTKNANLHAVEFANHESLGVAERLSGFLIDDIRGQPAKT